MVWFLFVCYVCYHLLASLFFMMLKLSPNWPVGVLLATITLKRQTLPTPSPPTPNLLHVMWLKKKTTHGLDVFVLVCFAQSHLSARIYTHCLISQSRTSWAVLALSGTAVWSGIILENREMVFWRYVVVHLFKSGLQCAKNFTTTEIPWPAPGVFTSTHKTKP